MHDSENSTPCRHYRDYLDLCCDMLSDENVALRYELRETRIDRDSYRALAQQAIHALADLHRRQMRQTERLRQLMGVEDDRWDARNDDPEPHEHRHEAAA